MSRYLPIAFGILLIVILTYIQVRMTDRFSDANVTAQQRAELLKNIPMNIGDWQGTDMPIDEGVRKTAGAIGAVSRQYHNKRTNEIVDLWLIVGHGRAISSHTPDICYPSSGFSARSRENSLYPMSLEDNTQVPFLTNTFFRDDATGHRLIRVFWTWYNTEGNDGKVVWEAPTNARWYFGNTRALYKMYFTSQMRDNMETSEQSPCLQFAKEFLPVVEKALSQVHSDDVPAAGAEPSTADAEPAETAAAPEATPAEKPAEESAPAAEEAATVQ